MVFLRIHKITNASMKMNRALFTVHHRCQKFHNDLRVAVISASTSSVARLNILNSIDTPGCRTKSIHISSVVEVIVAEAARIVASASTAAIQIEVQNNCVYPSCPQDGGKVPFLLNLTNRGKSNGNPLHV